MVVWSVATGNANVLGLGRGNPLSHLFVMLFANSGVEAIRWTGLVAVAAVDKLHLGLLTMFVIVATALSSA